MTTVEATSSLDGSKPLTWDNDKIEDQKLLQRFLAHVPGVRVFDDSKMPASHGSSMNALIDKLRKQELQSLSIVYCDPLPMECMESQGLILDSCSQGLETLRFSGTFDSRTQINNEILTANDTNRTASMKFIASLGIKQLLLEGNLAFQVRPSFISRCPNLRSLSLGVQSEGMVTSASGCIREYCPLLEELAVTFVNSNINPSCLVGLLEACGNVEPHLSSSSDFSIQESLSYTMSTLTRRVGLKKLVLSGIDFSQHRHSIIKTLCRQQSSTLTFIAIRSCKNIWSNDSATDGEEVVLCKLLTSLQKLEYIDFSLSGFAPVNFRDVSKVHASSLASPCMTWPCARTLRVLRIMIDGVSHISEHPTGLQESPQNLGLALENQLKICELLGMLTSLEELTLGIDENDGPLINNFPEWGYQTSCLELTLETGLSLMSGLKQLRLFKVTRMDHRMGQKEIEWVCRSWPHLKDILGLVRYQAELKSEFEAENLTEDEYREIEMLDWIKKYHPELRYT
ncbi:hypothetical protein BGZ46_008439 [Entomortierella lignicola]|nr:hypothetical protein BGZ46_008439 [Entomortierella lignicola]